jgi:hypothetical protein
MHVGVFKDDWTAVSGQRQLDILKTFANLDCTEDYT